MTKDELQEWKHNHITQEVLTNIRAHKIVVQEMLSSPSSVGEPNFALKQAQIIGILQGIDMILNVEVEDESTGTQDSN